MNKKVDVFLTNQTKWVEEQHYLRKILLSTNLEEDFKWNSPCYTDNGKNIASFYAFKDFCGIAFFKGALLVDKYKILYKQTENIQEGRLIRFYNIEEIKKHEKIILEYLLEAIDNERKGLKVELKKTEDFKVPVELETMFNDEPEFREAFYNLTPGRQRGYLYYFGQAKQSKTVISRIEKNRDKIFEGLGLQD